MSRTVLITGSSGIAAATARLAARSGDGVFLIGNDAGQGQALSAELDRSAFVAADVADEEAVRKAIDWCFERWGTIDSVFNVAGMSARSLGDGPLHQCSTPAWQKMLDVHTTGTFFVCREVLKHWIERSHPGTILNTSSVLARHPQPRHFATVAYAASKGAVESMTLSAASYYASHRIRLNVLAPALVRTPMSARAQCNSEILSFLKDKQAITGTLVEAEEIARIAYFLLSPSSYPMTGEVVRADAGWGVSG